MDMDTEYYDITSELNAREVLRYLNDLGIHNITGEVLKYFITDLKKLIKYDLEQRNLLKQQEIEKTGPERLHSASTFSSRNRSKTQSSLTKCSRECPSSRRPLNVRNVHSAPVLGRPKVQEEKTMRRACSCTAVERKTENIGKESRPTTSTYNNNLIKVPKQPVRKKCDPVTLYHYYSSLWEKYKPNVPGENDWSDLRWHIRQKMAGCAPVSERKNPEIHVKSKENFNNKK